MHSSHARNYCNAPMSVTSSQATEIASGANHNGVNSATNGTRKMYPNDLNDTLTATRLPSHAHALADVVSAIERADVPALVAALDEADTELLNDVGPLRWYKNFYHENGYTDMDRSIDKSSGEAFFNASFESDQHGGYPATLLSCLAYALMRFQSTSDPPRLSHLEPYWRDHHRAEHSRLHAAFLARTEEAAWWIRAVDRATWLKVFETLVNHPKVDVNARRTHEQIEELRHTWSFLPEDERPPDLPTDWYDDDAAIWDDQMTTWDYLFQTGHPDDDAPTWKFVADLATILARSGKLDPRHVTHNRDRNHGELQNLGGLVMSAMRLYCLERVHFEPLDALLEHVAYFPQARALQLEASSPQGVWGDDAPTATRIEEGIARTRRALLRRWCRAARRITFLARWWADARLAAYAPDGAGAKRAQQSFDAITTAVGW